MNIFLHVINLFFISVLESKQSLVQSFDTACTKSKCTQSSRGLGCSYQKLYHIGGEAVPLTGGYHNRPVQWSSSLNLL